ncbi:phosphate transporter [Gigaspora margarita]|uniref:Phosphate transporter n=1 Tax=Gigaspora margarita TaxID=4874 RepID=A0A8H4AXE7_GIGMA|nr:phosphate transporter [Gigaspora margarita]
MHTNNEAVAVPVHPLSPKKNFDYDFYYDDDDDYDATNLDILRRTKLQEIDNAEFQWFHIRACIVSGVGFFTDAYDLFVINLVSTMLSFVYFNGNIPTIIDTGLKMSAALGTLIGQLVFGWCADHYGRKKMYGLELSLMIASTLGSALCANSFAISLWGSLMFWRLILGVGIGGDYPLSAVITSEFATKKRRGAMMAAVFSMQGFGILSAAVVSLITLAIYKDLIVKDKGYIDHVWRIVLGFGIVPGVLALYFRLTIPETPRYTMDVLKDIEKGSRDIDDVLSNKNEDKNKEKTSLSIEIPRATFKDFISYFSKWKNAKVLIGTSVSWFVLDVAFYGIGLNNSIILEAIGFASSTDVYMSLWNMSVGNIIITMLGTVPGYWFTVFLVDKWGRIKIQLMGFIALTILFLILGFAYDQILTLSMPLFITIFTLCQFFQNFGPNATTFIIPGEVFPTRYRSTGHGISAASGKLGAVVAQIGFVNLKDIGGKNRFMNRLILIFAAFMFVGIWSTLLIPETMNQSLEELSNEDQIGFVKKPKVNDENSTTKSGNDFSDVTSSTI